MLTKTTLSSPMVKMSSLPRRITAWSDSVSSGTGTFGGRKPERRPSGTGSGTNGLRAVPTVIASQAWTISPIARSALTVSNRTRPWYW